MNTAVDTICTFFEQLTPHDLQRIHTLYTPDAAFKDPFNEVRGVPAIQQVFTHMFAALEQPRFVVTRRIVDGNHCFLVWDFHFRFRGTQPTVEQTVRGGSHLVLDADGRILSHRDYWDAAAELYEKLPVLGALMRWLKRRVNS